MKGMRDRSRIGRVLLGIALLVGLLVAVTACWPFNTLPVAKFTTSAVSGTAPLTVDFSAMLSYDPDGSIVSWEWDFGDGTSATGESTSHTFTAAGTYTVALRVTDNAGGQAVAQKTITVSASSSGSSSSSGLTASFTAAPLTGASPLTVTFNAVASSDVGHSINYYSWDFGDGVTAQGVLVSHIFSATTTTTYHVVLTVIASDNSEATVSKDIIVTAGGSSSSSSAPTASFTATPTSGALPLAVDFNASGSTTPTGTTIKSYAWTFGDGATTTGETPSHTYTTAGDYTVTLTVTDSAGAAGTEQKTIDVTSGTANAPTASFTASPTTSLAPFTVAFDASGSTTPTGTTISSYTWNFGDNTAGSGKTCSHTYTAAGNYTVTLTVQDSAGATGSAEQTIVSLLSPPAIP